MKSSLIVVAFFCIGCLVGIFNDFQFDMHNLSMYILYVDVAGWHQYRKQ